MFSNSVTRGNQYVGNVKGLEETVNMSILQRIEKDVPKLKWKEID